MPLDVYLALVFFIVVLVGTPGPANLILMAAGAKWGVRRCIPFIAGITVGKLLLNLVLAFGLLSLLADNPRLNTAMRVLSCIYLLWLAWRIAGLQLAGGGAIRAQQCPGFLAGLIVHPLNPKAWAMLTSAYAQFSRPDDAHGLQIALICGSFFAVQTIVHPLWCWGGHLLATRLGGSVREKIIMRSLALITAVMVIILTYDALRDN